jgi:hypothetical protein
LQPQQIPQAEQLTRLIGRITLGQRCGAGIGEEQARLGPLLGERSPSKRNSTLQSPRVWLARAA